MSGDFRFFNTGVFDKSYGEGQLQSRFFYLVLGLAVVYGLGLTLFISSVTSNSEAGMSLILGLVKGMSSGMFLQKIFFIIIFFAFFLGLPLIGAMMSSLSNDALISFAGYHFIILPFGFLNSILFLVYESNSIYSIFLLTLIAASVMCLLGASFPDFFSQIGGALGAALFALIVASIINTIFFGNSAKAGLLDYIGAGIFCLYIGYDFWRATEVRKTFDNAVDIAVQLYLDMLNLMLYLLKIMGKRKQ